MIYFGAVQLIYVSLAKWHSPCIYNMNICIHFFANTYIYCLYLSWLLSKRYFICIYSTFLYSFISPETLQQCIASRSLHVHWSQFRSKRRSGLQSKTGNDG